MPTEGAVNAKWQVLAGLLASAVVLVFTSLWLARALTRPMSHAVHVAERLADGDLTSAVHPSGNVETTQLLRAYGDYADQFGGYCGQRQTRLGYGGQCQC